MITSSTTYNQRRIARINETVEMYVTPDRPPPPLEQTLLLKSIFSTSYIGFIHTLASVHARLMRYGNRH